MHPGAASADTTRLKQLDAIRTTNPINLGWNGVTSELSFKHQVGLADCRLRCPGGWNQAVDRGIVQVQLANSSGTAVGTWRKIYPYENVYDDAGEDSFYQLPVRSHRRRQHGGRLLRSHRSRAQARPVLHVRAGVRLRPSGRDLLERRPSIPTDIRHASDGPGLQGSLGPGTWVESKFDLAR